MNLAQAEAETCRQPSQGPHGKSARRMGAKALAVEALRLLDQRQFEDASHSARKALAINPGQVEALHALGQCHLLLGRGDECMAVMGRLLRLRPHDAVAYNNRGVAHEQAGRLQEALRDYQQAVRLSPGYRDAVLNEALCLDKLQRFADALPAYQRALALAPDSSMAHFGLANVLWALGQAEAALQSYERAVAVEPGNGPAWYNMGNSLLELKRHEQAIRAYEHASALMPANAAVYTNCANALHALKQHEDALEVYDAALLVDPDHADAHFNKAIVFNTLGRHLEAVDSCSQVLRLVPDYPKVFNNLGVALAGLKQHEAAIDGFNRAIERDPRQSEPYANRANAQEILLRHDDAIGSYQQALAIKPEYPYLQSRLAYTQLCVCDWARAVPDLDKLLSAAWQRDDVCDPFRVIALTDSAALQRRVADLWQASHVAPGANLGPIPKWPRHDRVRLGYYSADLHMHATAVLMAEMFELHDRERFEIVAFSFGPDQQHPMRDRLVKAFDRFIDVRQMTDAAVAKLSRELEIDIAIDLKGFTLDSRMGIFQCRAAPIQVSYLGYPGTVGGDCMDYVIADHTLIPPEQRQHYSEHVIYLPGSYQVNDRQREVSERRYTRAELGLPENGFVFCCFNNNYKILPPMFDIWMRLLQEVPDSVLWLLAGSPTVVSNLRREAEHRGVDPERLVFAPRAQLPEHLARQKLADLFLDTLPCNAHTTASDALWMGLPVLTCPGESFASRVAASLVKAVGLDELVVDSLASYEARALRLASDPALLAGVRRRLISGLADAPLFDSRSTVRHIENGLIQAHQRWSAGEAKMDIVVSDVSGQQTFNLIQPKRATLDASLVRAQSAPPSPGSGLRPLRILFMGDASSPHTQRFVRHFAEIGHTCYLLSQVDADIPGVSVITPPNPEPVLELQAWMAHSQEAIRQVKPDLVHGHYASIHGLWAALSGFHPLALTLWGSDINVDPHLSANYKTLVRYALAQADLICGDSTDLNQGAVALAGFQIAAPQLIRFGVDTSVFRPGLDASELRRRFQLGNRPVVFSPRQFKPAANIHRILEAAPAVLDRHPEVVFVLMTFATGRDDYRLQLEAMASSLGDAVRFVDGCLHDEMPLWYSLASATLSLRDVDAGSVSVMESLSACTPVIASNIPSNLELIANAGGLLIDQHDVQAIADAIGTVLDNRKAAEQMGHAGRSRMMEMADFKVNMSQMERLYADMFRAWPASPGLCPRPNGAPEAIRLAIAQHQAGMSVDSHRSLEAAAPACRDLWDQAAFVLAADLIGHPIADSNTKALALSAILEGAR